MGASKKEWLSFLRSVKDVTVDNPNKDTARKPKIQLSTYIAYLRKNDKDPLEDPQVKRYWDKHKKKAEENSREEKKAETKLHNDFDKVIKILHKHGGEAPPRKEPAKRKSPLWVSKSSVSPQKNMQVAKRYLEDLKTYKGRWTPDEKKKMLAKVTQWTLAQIKTKNSLAPGTNQKWQVKKQYNE